MMMSRGRAGNGLVFNRMVLASLFLHVLFLSCFFLSPSLPEKKWTFGPVYSVELVSGPVNLEDGKKTAAMSREIVSAHSAHEPMEFKKRDESRPTPLLNPIASERAAKSDTLEKAIDNVRKKVSGPAPPAANLAAQHTAVSAPPKPGGSAEMDAKMGAYYARIWALIQRQWALPRGILPDHDLKSVIVIVILKDGTLAGLNIEKSSGNKYFDQSAARAIKKASPFPPLPIRSGTAALISESGLIRRNSVDMPKLRV